MLTTIVLGGPLGKRFGRVHRLDLTVPSPAEAVRALSAVCDGFRRYLTENSEPGYHVFVGRRDVGADDLAMSTGARVLTLMPALAGAKSGWFQVVAGAVLVVAGAVLTVYGYGAGVPLITAGISMMVGGVSQLLFAPPSATGPNEKDANKPSYAFNGPVNTLAQGHPVPICYGEMEVGSCVVSAGIVTEWATDGGFGGNGGSGQTGPGGAAPGGGTCPAPWVPILLADGREVPTGEVQVGMVVRTQHEETLEWGDYPVSAVELRRASTGCWNWRTAGAWRPPATTACGRTRPGWRCGTWRPARASSARGRAWCARWCAASAGPWCASPWPARTRTSLTASSRTT